MTRFRQSGLLIALIAVIGAAGWIVLQLSGEGARSANDSGVGPRATEGAASIDYPPDAPPLGVPVDQWIAAWGDPAGLAPLEVVGVEGDTEFWATETRAGISVAVDLAVVDGVVAVAQLSVENAAGDEDDAVLVDEIIPAFLAASGEPRLQSRLGMDDPETLFGDEPREATETEGGVTGYLAVNRFMFVLGAVGG